MAVLKIQLVSTKQIEIREVKLKKNEAGKSHFIRFVFSVGITMGFAPLI